MNPETALQNKIRLELSESDITNWRNNTAMGWAGKMVRGTGKPIYVGPHDVVVRNAYPVKAGLCEGSSDIICIKKVLITPDMVGQTIGQFGAVEVKVPRAKPTAKQQQFLSVINSLGGLAGVARSEEEALTVLGLDGPRTAGR